MITHFFKIDVYSGNEITKVVVICYLVHNVKSIVILLIDNFTENINFNNIKLIFINAVNILLIHFIGNLLKIMKFYE